MRSIEYLLTFSMLLKVVMLIAVLKVASPTTP
ncbi:hypothetical protein DyAD56_16635 [Dyella sp. AD56]|nr:hypothetical protein DyAD56_16635 [Dyella sp. AD56]